jgi:hypothetical protein
MPNWTTEKDLELALIILAANSTGKHPQWNLVVQAMQNEFTASAIAKRDIFLAAKAYFEGYNGKDGSCGDASDAGGAGMGTAWRDYCEMGGFGGGNLKLCFEKDLVGFEVHPGDQSFTHTRNRILYSILL